MLSADPALSDPGLPRCYASRESAHSSAGTGLAMIRMTRVNQVTILCFSVHRTMPLANWFTVAVAGFEQFMGPDTGKTPWRDEKCGYQHQFMNAFPFSGC